MCVLVMGQGSNSPHRLETKCALRYIPGITRNHNGYKIDISQFHNATTNHISNDFNWWFNRLSNSDIQGVYKE